ncbi:MAG: hypothetical protein HKL96_03950 [Phycisphaerales bacterium]|nr:hypothetical protein [Phycisphaerales bacterium]
MSPRSAAHRPAVLKLALGLLAIFAAPPWALPAVPKAHLPDLPRSLLPHKALNPTGLYNIGGHFARAKVIAATGDQSASLEFDVYHKPSQAWRAQYLLPVTSAVYSGDELELSFKFRAVAPSTQATLNVSLHNKKSYIPLMHAIVTSGPHWRAVQLYQTTWQSVPGGADGLYFSLGEQKQRIELADISLRVVKTGIKSLHFGGQWRRQAQRRIWLYRMAPLTVCVLDSTGRPWPQAKVHVAMLRHAFEFGTAVDADLLVGKSAIAQKYRHTFLKYFNHAEFENDLKWPEWDNPAKRKRTLQAIAWLQAHHIGIRGHNLVWPHWRYLPEKVFQLRHQPAALRQMVARHVANETRMLAGKVDCWDVVNEALDNHSLQDILGKSILISWYKIAHQNDPHAVLYINEYGIVTNGGHTRLKRLRYERLIHFLLDGKAPLGGIGVQCHFGRDITPPQRVVDILDELAANHCQLAVTELDINLPNRKIQGEYMSDFLTAAFSVPGVVGINQWGFWAGRHWRPEAALWNKAWTLRPVGKAYIHLVYHDWWTDKKAQTNQAGLYATRGFLGAYRISASSGGKKASEVSKLVTLSRSGMQVTLRLPGKATPHPPLKR